MTAVLEEPTAGAGGLTKAVKVVDTVAVAGRMFEVPQNSRAVEGAFAEAALRRSRTAIVVEWLLG